MKKEEKQLIVSNLTEQLKVNKHFYISDISGMDAASTQALRRECFNSDVKLVQVKNTLLKVAFENSEADYSELYNVLVGSSALMFTETGNAPAKLIKEFRKKNNGKPLFKAAYVEESAYLGEEHLETLVNIKSKEELLGDIVLLLQSPMQSLISALESGKNTIAGVVKTLSEKE